MSRVLIVEDDGLQGYELKQAIENRTDAAVWVVPSVSRAMTALSLDRIDFAILDVQVLDGHTFGLARYLIQAGVPFAFLSGSRRIDVPFDLAEYSFLPKPLNYPALHAAMQPTLSAAKWPAGTGFFKLG